MRRLALILVLTIPVLAVLTLTVGTLELGSWFGGSADEEDLLLDGGWLDAEDDDEEGEGGPFLTGRADLAALRAEEARQRRAAGLDGDDPDHAAEGGRGPGVKFVGKVLDPEGRPAAGVTVIAVGEGRTTRFTTAEDGAFAEKLPPGRYRLSLRAPGVGYRLYRRYLVDGSAEGDIQFELWAPGTLAVAILRGDEGVPGVPVSIQPVGFEQAAESHFERTTDADGVATFEEVPRATYDVVANVPDGPMIRKRQGVWSGERALRLTIPDGVMLKGKVSSGTDGPGVAGAEILLQVQSGVGLFETGFASGADGTFEVMVPRGRLRKFEVSAAGFAAWPNPANRGQRRGLYRTMSGLSKKRVKSVTLDIHLDSGASVLGRVTDDAEMPLPGVGLVLRPPQGASWISFETDDQGRYSVAALNPGRYEVMIEAPGWFAEQRLYFDIPRGASQPVTFDVTLFGARAFRGVVMSKAGKPVHGARVWIMSNSRPVTSARATGRALEMFTDASGRFELTDVPREISVSVRASHGSDEATPVWVSSEQAVPASIRLELGETGAVEGVCYDLLTRGELAKVRIQVQPVGKPAGRNGRTVSTSKSGRFKISRLIPGRWSLRPSLGGYLLAEPVVVDVPASDRAAEMDLPLDPGLIFTGVVTDPAGKPLNKVRLDVQGTVDGKKIRRRTGFTDGQGRFRITGFRGGNYRIRVRRGGFRPSTVSDLTGGEQGLQIRLLRK